MLLVLARQNFDMAEDHIDLSSLAYEEFRGIKKQFSLELNEEIEIPPEEEEKIDPAILDQMINQVNT